MRLVAYDTSGAGEELLELGMGHRDGRWTLLVQPPRSDSFQLR